MRHGIPRNGLLRRVNAAGARLTSPHSKKNTRLNTQNAEKYQLWYFVEKYPRKGIKYQGIFLEGARLQASSRERARTV